MIAPNFMFLALTTFYYTVPIDLRNLTLHIDSQLYTSANRSKPDLFLFYSVESMEIVLSADIGGTTTRLRLFSVPITEEFKSLDLTACNE